MIIDKLNRAGPEQNKLAVSSLCGTILPIVRYRTLESGIMPRDSNEAKAKALRQVLTTTIFHETIATNVELRSNADLASLLQQLDIAEAEYNRRQCQFLDPCAE